MPENLTTVYPIQNTIVRDAICGIGTGTFIAGAFNPWDRALYLSTSNNRPFLFDKNRRKFFHENLAEYVKRHGQPPYQFLTKFPGIVFENFQNPYDKFMQSIFSRIFSSGIYFFMQSQMDHSLYVYLGEQRKWEAWQAKAAVGFVAGGVAGTVSNWLYVIRAYSWDHKTHFADGVRRIYTSGGLAPFMKGIYTITLRDVTFGICNELLRYQFRDSPNPFLLNLVAGSTAAIVSSPLNYARNIKFKTDPSEKPPSIPKVLTDLWNKSQTCSSVVSRLQFFQQKFNIGWGTLRVGVGMAVGQQIFGVIKSVLSEDKESSSIGSKRL